MTSVELPTAPSAAGRPALATGVPTTRAMRVQAFEPSNPSAVAAFVVSAGVLPPVASPFVRTKLTSPLTSVVPVT